MYPRLDTKIIQGVFWCEVLEVVNYNTVLVRTVEMKNAYTVLFEELRDYYIDQGRGERFQVAALTPGTSCVVKHYSHAERGEIVYIDDQGYAEVNLVDEGRSLYIGADNLFVPEPLHAFVPVLNIECEVFGLGALRRIYYAEEIVAMVCREHTLSGVVMGVNGAGVSVVQFFDEDRQDIGALIVARVDEELPYGRWREDEGFEDGYIE